MKSKGLETVAVGVRFPKATLKKIDESKGCYNRNRYLLNIVDEYLAKFENDGMLGERRKEK
jgi:hypothetical protein